jgi:hypothetical protein
MGISVVARKQHTAVVYRGSMIVFGGTSENGYVFDDMVAYSFDEK